MKWTTPDTHYPLTSVIIWSPIFVVHKISSLDLSRRTLKRLLAVQLAENTHPDEIFPLRRTATGELKLNVVIRQLHLQNKFTSAMRNAE